MRGVLFGLDGTLLEIDQLSFLGRHLGALTTSIASLTGNGRVPEHVMKVID